MGLWKGAAVLAVSALVGWQVERSDARLYGRVLTVGGERLEGYLRWDRNETHWADFLDGRKEIPWENVWEAERLDEEFRRQRERGRRIRLPGLILSWEEDDRDDPLTADAGIRFGHLASIEVIDERRAVLVLKSGEEAELRGRSTDIGRAFRGLTVEDLERGEVELGWRDFRRVDFMSPPPGAARPSGERLHGSLRTRRGVELTGFVAWDLDEALSTDLLDGEEGGRDRRIELGSVATIEPQGRRGARVTLRSGEEMILTGSNDVNDDNRGIEISDPGLGRAVVSWAELESIVFHPPEGDGPSYEAFDGGSPLRGEVESRTGERLSGRIRWDNDEEHTWEVLDGTWEGVDYDIELRFVRHVEPVGTSAARVTLDDGR
ncbi:MAG TPA: hypothetical protein VLA09_03265, partial [Longimicrobiales bacterium]|nr:hypothetical protein [Longimicrobiales bacterium]